MAVMNRKLFANRQARNTLRNMGGIMASYPELMQEAQTFQVGGEVMTPYARTAQTLTGMAPRDLGGMDVGFTGTVVGDEYLQELFRRIDPNISREDYNAMSPAERRAAGFPEAAFATRRYFDIRDRAMEQQFPMQGPTMPSEEIMAEAVVAEPVERREQITAVDEFTGLPSEMTEPRAAAVDETEMDRLARESAEEAAAAREAAGITDARESIGAAIAAGDDEEAARIAEETRRALDETQDEENGAVNVPDGIDLEGMDGLEANPNETAEDLRSRYADRLKLFQEVLGGADEQTAQDKAMQLAMIGLAIAAGQSPDALTNISQGALAGLTAMSEQEAERRARDREMRAAALEAAIEDVNLGRRLASDERIAAMRAGEAGESSRQEYLFNSTFQTTYDYLVNTEQLDPAIAVQRARQAAAAAAPGAPSAQNMSITPEQEAALRERIDAAAGNEAELSRISSALTARGLNPSDYGL